MPRTERNMKWYEVYYILTNQLAKKYKSNSEEFPKELYQNVFKNSQHLEEANWLFKSHTEFEYGETKMLDPIQIFSWINDTRLNRNSELRDNLVNILFKSINDGRLILYKDIDYNGCPSPITFKQIDVRPNIIQRYIWEILVSSSTKSSSLEKQVKSAFSDLNNWYGIDIPSFTIFLFWIDSDNFLSLDGKTVELLVKYGYLKNRPHKYDSYKTLLTKKDTSLYREIVERANDDNTAIKTIKTFKLLGELFPNFNNKPIGDFGFGIIGIAVLNQNKFTKVLKIGEIYKFYQCFLFSNDSETVKYDNTKDVKLYNTNKTRINISAIVGKNGAGKSSITDLILVLFNNIAFKKLINPDLEYVKDIEIDMYMHIDTLYKVELRNDTYKIYKYEFKGKVYNNKQEYKLQEGDLFYNVILNYSHFALNSNNYGEWINSIYWKNDAYQTPIVLNPMRTNGNFDINKESYLVKNRLLSLILEPSSNYDNSIRYINSNHKYFESISIKLNIEKFNYLYKEYNSESKKDIIIYFPDNEVIFEVVEALFEYFEINFSQKIFRKLKEDTSDSSLIYFTIKYLYKKLINIARIYPSYKIYLNKQGVLININEYLYQLSNDNSHITFKLLQALNFVKFNLVVDFTSSEAIRINAFEFRRDIKIDDYSQRVQNVFKKELSNRKYKLEVEDPIYYIPPSFFDLELKLNDKSNFDELSSGEKQFIYSTSTFLYHLKNINSVKENSSYIKYDSVNLIIDEIEMYFHPEMQRNYVKNVIDRIGKLILNDIRNINIILVTHSPFILSDIPSENVLFLDLDLIENKAIQRKDVISNTFGGNITDILGNPFFLYEKGIIGEYAKEKINEVIEWINDTKEELTSKRFSNNNLELNLQEDSNEDLQEKFTLKLNYCKSIISLIGEKVIRVKLDEMLDELEILKSGNKRDKFIEIKSLELEKEKLQLRIDKLKKEK